VRATIVSLDGLSAHADRDDILRWCAAFESPPRQVHVVHGEAGAANSLAEALRTRFGWNVAVAKDGATVRLPA
jgi:metallo-beta-lactamase family protein